MKYTCDDFVEIKVQKGKRCSVGMFGIAIYAVKISVADGHHSYHHEYYQIFKEEFDNYPENADVLIEKYYHGHGEFLCSDYLGREHATYEFLYSK